MRIADICEVSAAELVCGNASSSVCGACIDSRLVKDGMMFVAFAGEKVDGNSFAKSSIEAGAACVLMTCAADEELISCALEHDAALLRAKDDDAEGFLLKVAAAWRARNAQWAVVGVTGSVGKTTTKDMCCAALSTRYKVHATAGNYNNLIGVPLTLLSASSDDEVLVVEMGMNSMGEIAKEAACAQPNVALITNVGTSHIGMLGSRENIARAKAEIVAGLVPNKATSAGPLTPSLILSSADDYTGFIMANYAEPAGVRVYTVGNARDDRVRAANITLDEMSRASFEVHATDGWNTSCTLQVPGRQVVGDALLALMAAELLGVDKGKAAAAISAMKPSKMRLELKEKPSHARVIDDSYNASPSSTALALDVLMTMACEGRRIAVIGQIGELGSESERLHAYVGAYAAAKGPDLLVLVGDEGVAPMREAALTMGFSEDKLECFATCEAAIKAIVPLLQESDLVLCKGSRSVGLDKFVQEVLGS